MSETATIITTPPRVADEHLQDAVYNVMRWASLGHEPCPSCGASAAARDHMDDADQDAWDQFIFRVRRWLEDPDSDSAARYDKARGEGEAKGEGHLFRAPGSKAGKLDPNRFQDPVILDTREADGETQRAIADMLSWSLASAQTQCCGNSLGPDESAQKSIAELCGWLGMTWAELEAAAQRWSFELDDPMKSHRVRKKSSGRRT